MAPKFKKKQRKPVSGSLHGRFSAKKHVYGQLQGAPTHSHREAPEKHSMGGKNLVLLFEWQGLVECCCCSSESQMAAVASRYFLICLVELSVGFVFGSASVQTAGRTPSLGLLP